MDKLCLTVHDIDHTLFRLDTLTERFEFTQVHMLWERLFGMYQAQTSVGQGTSKEGHSKHLWHHRGQVLTLEPSSIHFRGWQF